MSLEDVVGARVRANVIRGAGSGIVSRGGRFTEIADNSIVECGFGIGITLDVAPSIRGNRLINCALFGVLTMQSLARVAYVENHVSNVGSLGTIPFGLGALFVIGEWHVESNEVLNVGLPPVGVANPVRGFGIIGSLILESRIAGNLVSYSDINALPDGREDRALQLQGLIEFAIALASQVVVFGFSCQITDNKFIGKGATALVELRETPINDNINIRFERIFFNQNYCLHFGGTAGQNTATVLLRGRAGVAMGNQIKAGSNLHPSLNFSGMQGTILGNITEAAIVNHPDFPAPSGSFNLVI